jgi:excisionase family DNA binding protein
VNATQRQTLDAGEVAQLFGVARVTVYRAVASGDLNVIRVRRRLLFPRAEVLRLLHIYEGSAPDVAQAATSTAMRQVAA